MKEFPKEIFVYQSDEVDGEPVYAVATNVDEILDDTDGTKVGVYTLKRVSTFRVYRELK